MSHHLEPLTRFPTSEQARKWTIILSLVVLALIPRLYELGTCPPGISRDELFNAVDALRIGEERWFVFVEGDYGNYGREAFFIYLMALSLRLLGQTIFAIRLPAALLGIGSVVLSYLIGCTEFRRRVGVWGAALMAVSLWPIMGSRWGLRAVSLTFCTALTFYTYGRALRSRRRQDWLLSGIALGLTLYTYIPGRVFPLVVVTWFGWMFFSQREQLRQNYHNILISLVSALIVFAPFGWYIAHNPDQVNERINVLHSAGEQALSGNLAALIEPVSGTLKMFTFLGDNDWRYHVSGRPVFDPFTGLFFYVGLVVCLWCAFRRGAGAAQRPSYAILILWLGAMLAPNAVLEANPSFLRAAGGIVPTYLIVAIGLDYVYTWIVHKWPNLKHRWLPSVLVIGLSLTLADSWHSYFSIWKNNPTVRWVYQADLAMIGRYLNEHPPHADTRIFIGNIYVLDLAPQTFIYYSRHHTDWFDPTNSFAWSEPTGTTKTWYFVPASIALPSEALQQLSSSEQISRIMYPDGELAFTLYHVAPGQINWSPQYSTDLDFVNGPSLVGYDISDTLYRGDTSTMTLHWQIPAKQQRLPNQLTWAQVQLEDGRGHTWGEYDSLMGYPQASWSSHDRFIQVLNLKIPSGMPPGPAYLHFDLHDNDGQFYNIVENWPNQAGPFAVRSHPQASFELKPNTLVFDNTLALQDYAFSGLLVPGLPINISLDWAVSSPPTIDYRLQLQLILPGEPEPYLTQTFELWPGVYPPSQWQAGEQVTTFHRLKTPLDIPTDTDPELRIQLLNPETSLPLPVTQGSNKLADMTLQLRDHLFEHPPISHPFHAQFGSSIQLLGYDIDTSNSRPNGDVRLTLYWQAKDTPPDAYTVFNHVVDENGQLRWQLDSPPVADAWLTSTWFPGEIVIDQRVIPIGSDAANGRYALIIGLYTHSDGQRLPVYVDGHPQANDQLILTEIVIGP